MTYGSGAADGEPLQAQRPTSRNAATFGILNFTGGQYDDF